MFKIGKYTIKKADELQFSLYKDTIYVDKKTKESKETERFIGYYGYLGGVLNKIINLELLEASSNSDEYLYASDVLDALTVIYDHLNNEYHKKPKEI